MRTCCPLYHIIESAVTPRRCSVANVHYQSSAHSVRRATRFLKRPLGGSVYYQTYQETRADIFSFQTYFTTILFQFGFHRLQAMLTEVIIIISDRDKEDYLNLFKFY